PAPALRKSSSRKSSLPISRVDRAGVHLSLASPTSDRQFRAATLTWLKRWLGRPGSGRDGARAWSGIQDVGNQCHAHQIGQARGLHLGHQVGAVDLDRAWADPEVESDLLVGKAADQALQHLALAVGECGQTAVDLCALGFVPVLAALLIAGGAHGLEQSLVIERLLDKIRSADLHRLNRERNIAVSGHDDDRNRDAKVFELA